MDDGEIAAPPDRSAHGEPSESDLELVRVIAGTAGRPRCWPRLAARVRTASSTCSTTAISAGLAVTDDGTVMTTPSLARFMGAGDDTVRIHGAQEAA